MTKVCYKCKVEQPEANYSKRCNTPDGLRYDCKDCNSAYNKANREQIIAYRESHREQNIEYMKQYYAGHKEEYRYYSSAYARAHKETIFQRTKVWAKNHPDVRRVCKQTRRAKEAGLASTLTPEQWKHILDKFNNTCAYCGVGDKTLHQEHFVPVTSRGEYTHDNIIPACKSCNSSKGIKDFLTWYPTTNHYDKQREKKIMRFLHYTGAAQQLTLWVVKGEF